MDPILLIYGCGSEDGTVARRNSVAKIYSDLPRWLRHEFSVGFVFEIDLSRYIFLEDGVDLDDVAPALDNVLHGAPLWTDRPSSSASTATGESSQEGATMWRLTRGAVARS